MGSMRLFHPSYETGPFEILQWIFKIILLISSGPNPSQALFNHIRRTRERVDAIVADLGIFYLVPL